MDELLDLCASDDEGLLADGLLAHVPATQPTAQTTTTTISSSSSSSSSSDSSDEGEDIFASAAEVSRRRAAAKKAQVAAAAEENAAARAAQAEDADRRKRERAASRRASRSRSRSVSPELTASPPRASTTAPATAGAGAAASGTARASRRKRKRSKRSRQFYGVYLLASLHPSHTRSAYIGFTVNPPRRIRQHNGEVKGGAWKTHSKRPWEMQLVLHGFPSQVVALQFEWAWQQPLKSKPMRDAMYRAGLSERGDASRKVKVLCEMLSLPPWSRYPLTLRWLKPENRAKLLRGCRPLPPNIRVTEGSVDQIDIDEIVDEDSDLESDDEAAANGTRGLSLPHTYGSQLSQPLGLSQDGTADTNQDAPGPRLVAALRRAGQAVDCAVCGDDLSPPYAKHNCFISAPATAAATVPMRAHLHCLGLSFITRAEQEEPNGVGSVVLGAQSVNASTSDCRPPVPWVPTTGKCPACCEEQSWADWLRMTKYRFPLRRQSADEGGDEESAAAPVAGRGGEISESESEGEGNGYMFSDTDTESEAVDPAAAVAGSNRTNNEQLPPTRDELEEQESLGTDSSDSEIDTEQTLAERLGRRQRQKKRRRAQKPPAGVCILSPVADLGDREEAEAVAEDDVSGGEHMDEAAERHKSQLQYRRIQSTTEEISLLSPSLLELSPDTTSPEPDLEQIDGDRPLDSRGAGSTQQHARHLSSSEDEDEAALLDSDSDCVVLMTQNEHT